MTTDNEPAKPEDSVPELYDHAVKAPAGAGMAVLASFVLFGAGQLLKGHFKRFFVLWGILGGLIGLLVLSSLVTEPGSAASGLSLLVIGIAMFFLWCYQLWDAFARPQGPRLRPPDQARRPRTVR